MYVLNIQIKTGNEYHQYDFFVYPRELQVDRSYIGWLTKFFRSDGEKSNLTPLSTEEMAKKCLLEYLEPYKNIFLQKAEYSANFVREIKNICWQHEHPMVHHPKVNETPNISVGAVKVVSGFFNLCMTHCNYTFKYVRGILL